MWRRSVCCKDCPDCCGLLVQVEDGRISAVKGDPEHPYTQGFICRKAGHFPEHVHNPARITTPLKRSGPKGSGRFEPVTWDQALGEVAARMQDTAAAHGPEAILPFSYAGTMGLVQRQSGHALFHKLGASRLLYTICSAAASAGYQASLGSGPSTDIESAAGSDYILIWGSNTLSTNLHAWPWFQKARKQGAKIVVIDPYCNRTAKKADQHLMLKPGSDAALALGMMSVLISQGLVDRDYIAAHTLGYEQLVSRAAEYPPERAARLTGLSAQEIAQVAQEYGRAKAPYIRTGAGPARQLAGGMAMRTIALLPALVGAFARPGGGITRSLGGAPSDLTSLTRPDLCPPGTRAVNMVHLGDALTKLDGPPIKMLYVYLSNPAAVAPQSRQVLAGLARDDLFTVVQEMFLTDTARYADLILPGASSFEVSDLYRSYGQNYLQMARPAIPPVGRSRSTLAIFQDLAARLGFTEEVFSASEDDFMRAFLAAPSPALEGVDMDALWQGEPVRLNIPANPYAHGFNTPSGKVEFFSQSLADKGHDPLPSGEVVRDPEGGAEYPLELITPPHHLLLNSAFNEIQELRGQAGRPRVMIHPHTAAERGIADGQEVKLFNRRGECRLWAWLTDDTRPELLVLEGIHWPQFFASGGVNQLTSQRLADMGETCAFHCNAVEISPV
ncbi:MAG: molybdopterin-dependent oxidoreductase [Desulfarculaceae bacterium]|nr:molybdopterin-dependent oxidoreductase [Desulfarculaceae bacterium]MCF8071360.1 molybdopterin-dependent oxidoreductase [Desulfarculaceae bacterium]MCF8101685.1 molybdopterin-dependent oxidoreductase [Desulfarculaceae bacterium]MCF8116706.1 molybdopterin-dependent oxidoreductase [Desulfarculaceae bacterium]